MSWPLWLDAALAQGLAMRAHALLLHAPGALGQFELAMALARAALCESPQPSGQACGRCASCHLMAAHSHPDFHLLLPEVLRTPLGWGGPSEGDDDAEVKADAKSKAKPSREIKIDALRKAIDWSQKTAARGHGKALVIHPAEAMNRITANALLKTLEEPPGRLLIVLTATDPEGLLPTVRSRCQRLAIAMPSADDAKAWLAGQGVDAAEVLLAAAGGQPQGVLALLEEGVTAADWNALPAAVRRGQAAAIAAWPLPRVVDALHKLCCDLMSLQAGAGTRFFSAAALAPAARPALPSWAALVAWQQALQQAARHEDHPWHAALRTEALVSQAAALWQTARATPPARGGALATLPAR